MHDFADIYDRYFARVYNYVRYRVGDSAQADDVASRVFEKALDRLRAFDGERGRVDAWLFAIARNAVIDHFRERRPAEPISDAADALPSEEPLIEDALARGESTRGVAAALRTLDEREREILALKFGARMTNRDIAAETGLGESHVGVLLFRAVKKLRSVLGLIS